MWTEVNKIWKYTSSALSICVLLLRCVITNLFILLRTHLKSSLCACDDGKQSVGSISTIAFHARIWWVRAFRKKSFIVCFAFDRIVIYVVDALPTKFICWRDAPRVYDIFFSSRRRRCEDGPYVYVYATQVHIEMTKKNEKKNCQVPFRSS